MTARDAAYPEKGSPVTDDDELQPGDDGLDALCEAWVWWRVTHGVQSVLIFSPPSPDPWPSGQRALRRPARAFDAGLLAAFQVAYSCQPNALDKQVFDMHYLARVRPVKVAAARLGIGHRQFYRVLESFRVRLEASARAFAENAGQDGFPDLSAPSAVSGQPAVNEKSVTLTRRNIAP